MFFVENNTQKLNLKKIKFNCDEMICPDMEHMPMWSHLNKTNFSIFLGKPASGKTTLMMSILRNKKLYAKKFDNIVLVMPPNSRQSLASDLLIDPGKIYDSLENIDEIYDRLDTASKAGERTLLILDDVSADLKSSKQIEETLSKIIYNMRHLKTTIFLLVQSYITIPKNMRKCITNLFVFKLSKNEMEVLSKEIFEMDSRETLGLLKLYEKKHDYLFINVNSQQMFRNQDYVIKKG